MKWEKPSEELATILAEKLKSVECEKRKMFGQLAYFINGNMFIGVFESSIFLRLDKELKSETMTKHKEITHFEPRAGRIMKEYVVLPANLLRQEEIFSELLAASIDYVTSLPPKTAKK